MDRLKTTTSAASPYLQNRHTRDGATGVLGGQHDRGGGEVVVDLVHLEDDVVWDLRLGDQHGHMAGEATVSTFISLHMM